MTIDVIQEALTAIKQGDGNGIKISKKALQQNGYDNATDIKILKND